METLSLNISYRPIRIGWCIRQDDFESLRKSVLLTHTLYGGRFNPIIVVDDTELAKSQIELFSVDALFAVSPDEVTSKFINGYKHLAWPIFNESFFIKGSNGIQANYLDIYHPIRRIKEEIKDLHADTNLLPVVYKWSIDDPLKDIFLMTFGYFPSKEEIGIDYLNYVTSFLTPKTVEINPTDILFKEVYKHLTINRISAFDLKPFGRRDRAGDGIYIGSSANIEDLINYWNLRAGYNRILFYDPQFETRLKNQKDDFLSYLRENLDTSKIWKDHIKIWSRYDLPIDIKEYGSDVVRYSLSVDSWNGLNIRIPSIQFDEKSVLGAVSENGKNIKITFQLPTKPFYSDTYFYTQHCAVNIRTYIDLIGDGNGTIKLPFIPELNEYYGGKYFYEYDAVRSNQHGISIIIPSTKDVLTIQSLGTNDLLKKIFNIYGYNAELSQPGLIASRLIRQLGGLQGCRVLKIAGVRDLIEKYSPAESFSRSNAIQLIRKSDSKTGKINFKQYERLFIEQRSHNTLKPEDAFKYLLSKDVFRIGLNFKCPDCELIFWLSIDESKKRVKCEYCGNEFDISNQLKDRDWAYRRSGLFGKENNQEGSIPVSLTLQQLDTALSMHSIIYSTGLNLVLENGDKKKCEIDFALLTQDYDLRPKIAIGECKTRKPIEENCIKNLIEIADNINGKRIDVFIILAKLSEFTPEEINLAKGAQGKYRKRVILLSTRELEPYHIYDNAKNEFEINKYSNSLEDLAEITHQLYFDPKKKK